MVAIHWRNGIMGIALFIALALPSVVLAAPNQQDAQPAEGANVIVIRLDLSTNTPDPGSALVANAEIMNIGSVTGTYSAELLLDNTVVGTTSVQVAPQERRSIQFSITAPQSQGNYIVKLGDQVQQLAVNVPLPSQEGVWRVPPDVILRVQEDTVRRNQDGVIELFINNPSLNTIPVSVDILLNTPSGTFVWGQELASGGGAGAINGSFIVNPGISRTVTIFVKSNNIGDQFIHSRVFWWPGEQRDAFKQINQTNRFTVVDASEVATEPPKGVSTNGTVTAVTPEPPEDTQGWLKWLEDNWPFLIIFLTVFLGGIAIIIAVRGGVIDISRS